MRSGKCFALLGELLLAATVHAAPLVTYDYVGATLTDYPAFGNYDPYGPDVFGMATFDATVVTAGFTGVAQSVSAALGTGAYVAAATGIWPATSEPSFDFQDGKIVGWSLTSTVTLPPFYLVPIMSTSAGGDQISPTSGGPEVLGFASTSQIGAWTEISAVPEPATGVLLLAGVLALLAQRRRRA